MKDEISETARREQNAKMNDIKKLLEDVEDRHSDFQIENFMIGKHWDKWAQYKQCLLEISTRYDSVQTAKLTIANIKKFDKSKWSGLRLFFMGRKKRFKLLSKMNFDLREAQKIIKNVKPELDCLLKLAFKLKKYFGEITPEKRCGLERESWQAKALKMAAMDINLTGQPSLQTLEFILSFPKDSQAEILNKLLSEPTDVLLGIKKIGPFQNHQAPSDPRMNQKPILLRSRRKDRLP
jgi:hypothetical protein